MISKRRHSAFGIGASCALLLWSTSLILGICCPIAPAPPCHGGRAPNHCMAAALEKVPFDLSIFLAGSAVAIAGVLPRGQEQPPRVARSTGKDVTRGVRRHLLIDVLRI